MEPPRPSVRLSTSGSLPSIAAQRSIEPKDLRKSLTGDLDWIVMKSLEKERSRRYETANGFAQDIERFLNDEAVEACPPSRSYLLKKFVRKHKGQVVAVSAVVFALMLGVMTTSILWIQAKHAEQRAVTSEWETRIALDDLKKSNNDLANEVIAKELHFINGLLRPIGYGEEVGDAELWSFVDWSAIPVAESDLKLKVLEVAFQNPDTALRLARRADRAIQSCAGLSTNRRSATIQLLDTKQQDQKADPRIRVAACWLAMELRETELPALTETIDWLCKPNPNEDSPRPKLAAFISFMTERINSLSNEQITRGGDALIEVLGKNEDWHALEAAGNTLVALAPKLSDEQIRRGRESLLKIAEKGDAGRSAAVKTLLLLPPDLDAETRTRIVKVLKNDFRCDFVVKHLSTVAPQLDPPNGAAFSQKLLSQFIDDDTTTVESYLAHSYGNPAETITMAVPEATYIARTLAHPGAVGDIREALLKRFEELVLYGGQHIFITEEPEDESSDMPAATELGVLTPHRSPEPPPRKLRTIHDAQLWIQQNWLDFKLDETPEVQWRGRK